MAPISPQRWLTRVISSRRLERKSRMLPSKGKPGKTGMVDDSVVVDMVRFSYGQNHNFITVINNSYVLLSPGVLSRQGDTINEHAMRPSRSSAALPRSSHRAKHQAASSP